MMSLARIRAGEGDRTTDHKELRWAGGHTPLLTDQSDAEADIVWPVILFYQGGIAKAFIAREGRTSDS